MNSIGTYLLATTGLAALAVTGSIMSSRSAIADTSKDVVVTPLPLPVTVTGTPTVALSGNSSAAGIWTRNVNDAQPVHSHVSVSMTNLQPASADTLLYTVPAGRRLVIEYASAECSLPAGEAISLLFFATLNGATVIHDTQLSSPAPVGNSTRAALGQSIRLYADPGTNVFTSVVRTDTTGLAGCNVQTVGYLTPLP